MRILGLTLALLLIATSSRAAAEPSEFVIGNKPCGTLRKRTDADGVARWHWDGCPRQERLLSPPTKTPTPTPTATVAPTPTAACPDGELPDLGVPGFEGWKGLTTSAPYGAVRTWCFTLREDTSRLAFSVGDANGAAQCLVMKALFSPPPGTGVLPRSGGGTNTSQTFLVAPGALLPRGTWTVRVEMLSGQNPNDCGNRFRVVVHK